SACDEARSAASRKARGHGTRSTSSACRSPTPRFVPGVCVHLLATAPRLGEQGCWSHHDSLYAKDTRRTIAYTHGTHACPDDPPTQVPNRANSWLSHGSPIKGGNTRPGRRHSAGPHSPHS